MSNKRYSLYESDSYWAILDDTIMQDGVIKSLNLEQAIKRLNEQNDRLAEFAKENIELKKQLAEKEKEIETLKGGKEI